MLFVDYNQNARDHTIASAYSRARQPERHRLHADPLGRGRRRRCPSDFTIATVPARFAEMGDLHAGDRRRRVLADPLLEWADRDEREGAPEPVEPDEPERAVGTLRTRGSARIPPSGPAVLSHSPTVIGRVWEVRHVLPRVWRGKSDR